MFLPRIPSICKPKPTWSSCLTKARENVIYVKLYSKLLVVPTEILSPEEQKLKNDVEWGRDFNDLKILREVTIKDSNILIVTIDLYFRLQ